MLRDVLKIYELLFDGTLGTWKTKPVDMNLQLEEKPFHDKLYPVPRAHEAVFRKEVERLCQIGVSKKVNISEWGSPTFIQPKNNGTVQLLSDFRKIN